MVASLNMGTDIDGKSPKDRAMIVGYKGSEGYAKVDYQNTNTVTFENHTPDYEISNSSLVSTTTGLSSYIQSHYNSTYSSGGTPTLDGMVEAKARYAAATPTTTNYNKASYTVNGAARQRKTVYILITDGAANTAKWANLSPTAQKMITSTALDGSVSSAPSGYPYLLSGSTNDYHNGTKYYSESYQYWNGYYYETRYRYYYDSYGYKTYSSYTTGFKYDSSASVYRYVQPGVSLNAGNKSWNWSDNNYGAQGSCTPGPAGTIYGYSVTDRYRREFYEAMLQGMRDQASLMRTAGGVGGTGEATFVSAFWEDYRYLSGYNSGTFGAGWDQMKKTINPTFINMAGTGTVNNNQDLYVNSTDFGDFTNKLTETFRKVASSVLDNVSIKATAGVDVKANYTLEVKDALGNWKPVTQSPGTKVSDQEIFIDFENMTPGSYRITYHMTENEFKAANYDPVNLSMSFEGKTTEIKPVDSNGNRLTPEIIGNPKTDCDIGVTKMITETQADMLKVERIIKSLISEKHHFILTRHINLQMRYKMQRILWLFKTSLTQGCKF